MHGLVGHTKKFRWIPAMLLHLKEQVFTVSARSIEDLVTAH